MLTRRIATGVRRRVPAEGPLRVVGGRRCGSTAGYPGGIGLAGGEWQGFEPGSHMQDPMNESVLISVSASNAVRDCMLVILDRLGPDRGAPR